MYRNRSSHNKHLKGSFIYMDNMALTVKRNVGVKSNVVVQRGYGLEEEEMFIPVLGKLTKVYIPKIKNVIEKKETHNQVNVQGLAQWLYLSWVYSSEAQQYADTSSNITPPNNTITLLNNGSAVTTLNANAYVILQQTLTGWVWLFIAVDNTTASYTANQIQLDISLFSITSNSNMYYVPIGAVPNFATANISITKTSDTYISVSWFISFNITGLTQGTNAILNFAWSVYNTTPLGGYVPNAVYQGSMAVILFNGVNSNIIFGYVTPSGPSTTTLNSLEGTSFFSVYFDSNSAYLAMSSSVSVSSGTIINGFIFSPPYYRAGSSDQGVIWEPGTPDLISIIPLSTYYFTVPVPQFTVSTSGVLPYVITFVFTPQT
ncbi:hypothetical protein SSRV2_ORF36 [Saccharolobus shibatae rod virus 2]|nr:hypothetical protein SSRV2_ORF36 [Saccharolobus shibatae rod virus 2]